MLVGTIKNLPDTHIGLHLTPLDFNGDSFRKVRASQENGKTVNQLIIAY